MPVSVAGVDYLDLPTAARVLDLHPDSVRRAAREGRLRLRQVRIGNRRFFATDDVERAAADRFAA